MISRGYVCETGLIYSSCPHFAELHEQTKCSQPVCTIEILELVAVVACYLALWATICRLQRHINLGKEYPWSNIFTYCV